MVMKECDSHTWVAEYLEIGGSAQAAGHHKGRGGVRRNMQKSNCGIK
jgi:hypothetical protein